MKTAAKKPIPRTDSGTPPRSEHASGGEFRLESILATEEKGDDADDTGVFMAAIDKHDDKDGLLHTFVLYLHKKHVKLAERFGALEKKIDRAAWMVAGAIAFAEAIKWLAEHRP